LDSITFQSSSANYGALAYLTETTAPILASFTLQNSLTMTTITASKDGGIIWASHTNLVILITGV
jgi:hypothetical protein